MTGIIRLSCRLDGEKHDRYRVTIPIGNEASGEIAERVAELVRAFLDEDVKRAMARRAGAFPLKA